MSVPQAIATCSVCGDQGPHDYVETTESGTQPPEVNGRLYTCAAADCWREVVDDNGNPVEGTEPVKTTFWYPLAT